MTEHKISRRNILRAGATLGAYSALCSLWKPWLPRLAFAQNGVQGDVIVCVFLRGGADALNMIVPHGDENYYKARPLLAFDPPDRKGGTPALELDNFFGLNPDMGALHELFQHGSLAAVHAVGPPKVSRSHFEAMASMESGLDGEGGAGSGWLGRHLMATASSQDSPLRAVGWGDSIQPSLRGYVSATALNAIADFHLHGDRNQVGNMQATLAGLYEQSDVALSETADATLQVLDIVSRIDIDTYRPANRASYDDSDLGRGLKQTAALIKAQVGLEAACIDHGNFDTHVAQGRREGLLSGLVATLADNLRAFHDDMLDYMDRVTVVVMSEFGRRVQENGGGGTDHGHGGAMYVMSNHVTSTPVIAEWPTLNSDFLDNGDLEITVDYRDVLGEVLLKRASNTDLSFVFPEHTFAPVGILRENA